jgi:hypothetical protein
MIEEGGLGVETERGSFRDAGHLRGDACVLTHNCTGEGHPLCC